MDDGCIRHMDEGVSIENSAMISNYYSTTLNFQIILKINETRRELKRKKFINWVTKNA